MRNFILGTDWGSDCDDAIAVRLLARAAKAKEIKLLGIGINACIEHSVASLKAFLDAEGLCDIPIGIDTDATDFTYNSTALYQKRLASLMPGVSNANGENAVRLYRRLIAEADEKVEIAEIGFLQVIASVLESGADDISPKSGIELFKEKVDKVWVMAGKWNEDGGKEYNFSNNARTRAGGITLCEKCPVPITFLGWEVGYGVITGNHLDRDDILYRILADHGSENGRHSWDPMLVSLALTGDEHKAGYDTATGYASLDPNGGNHFILNGDGMHKFVIKKHENEFYSELINQKI